MPHRRCTTTGTSQNGRPSMKTSKPRNSTMWRRTWWTRFSSSSRIVTLPCPSTRDTGSIATRRNLCGDCAVSRLSISEPLVVIQETVVQARHAPEDEVGEELPDRVARRRAARQEVVDADDLI